MAVRRIIQVFEHESLRLNDRVGGVLISQRDLDALSVLHSRTKEKFFDLIHKGIKFTQYVGVMQAGSLIIEVLPKADKNLSKDAKDEDKLPWRALFVKLLTRVGIIPGELGDQTSALLQHGSLLDLYVAHFLHEVKKIGREGVLRAYAPKIRERIALKGQILFAKQVHREIRGKVGFESRAIEYDRNHHFNQILVAALNVIQSSRRTSLIRDILPEVEELFSGVDALKVTSDTFARLIFDRKSERYRLAIELARPILLSIFPGVKAGADETLSLMFDMNQIWERYVLNEVRRAAPAEEITVDSQVRRSFWGNNSIRPDIVIKHADERYVIDTKWKALSKPDPSAGDLQQMFAYNHVIDSVHSVLLYPDIFGLEQRTGEFKHTLMRDGKQIQHRCSVAFVKPWIKEGAAYSLNKKLGAEVLRSARGE